MNRPLGPVTPGEAGGIAIYTTAAALWLTLVIAAMTGTIDDLIVWVFGPEFLRTVAMWAGVVAMAAVAVVAVRGSAIFHSHGNGSRAQVVRHEKAHQRALRRAGGGGSSRKIWQAPNGRWAGMVSSSRARFNRLPRASRAAVYLAGARAAPGTNCDRDSAAAAQILAGAPAHEWDEANRLADRWAR